METTIELKNFQEKNYLTINVPVSSIENSVLTKCENLPDSIRAFGFCFAGWLCIAASLATLTAIEIDDPGIFGLSLVLFVGIFCTITGCSSYCHCDDNEVG